MAEAEHIMMARKQRECVPAPLITWAPSYEIVLPIVRAGLPSLVLSGNTL